MTDGNRFIRSPKETADENALLLSKVACAGSSLTFAVRILPPISERDREKAHLVVKRFAALACHY